MYDPNTTVRRPENDREEFANAVNFPYGRRSDDAKGVKGYRD